MIGDPIPIHSHAGGQCHDPVFPRGDLRAHGRLSAASIGAGSCRFFFAFRSFRVLSCAAFRRNGESEQGGEAAHPRPAIPRPCP